MAGRAARLIVVLDASAFISAALKADSIPERALLRAVAQPKRLILSQAVEDEYRAVIVLVAAEQIEPTEVVCECRDPKDDKYLALAAAVIVSSDARHLLPMHPWRGISILSPSDYLALA
jgi:uncharacterized protein